MVAGMSGCGLCNPPVYVVSMTRDISDCIFLALPACIWCMSLCIVWLQLDIFYAFPRLTHLIFFPAEADLDLCMHCTSRKSTAMHLLHICIVFISMHNLHFTLSLIFSQVYRCQFISKTFLRSHQFCLNRFALSIDEFTWNNFGDPVNSACVSLGIHTPVVELSVLYFLCEDCV